jgi:hypothetical protein
MRLALCALTLAACAPVAPPPAELAGREPALAEMTYHCTPQGNEYVRFDYTDGGFDEMRTGNQCNYESWRRDIGANGPIHSRPRMTYEEWLRARGDSEA